MAHVEIDLLAARLRVHRDLWDLTQDQAAEELARLAWERNGVRVGVDGSMVSKWERGAKRLSKSYRQLVRALLDSTGQQLGDARLETDEDMKRRQLLTGAAAVGTGLLVDRVAPPAAAALLPTQDPAAQAAVAAIRRVLLGYDARLLVGTGSLEPNVRSLTERVQEAWQLRQRSQYLTLGELLPGLIVEAQAAAEGMSGDDRLVALRLLAHAYNATSSVLNRFGDPQLAVIAADRAIQTAKAVDEPLLVAASAYRLANVFLPAGRLIEAKETATSAAALLEPGLDSSDAQLATWGGLLLTAALATARRGEWGETWELMGEAKAAARRLGADHVDLHTIFGPTNVAIHGVQVAIELGDGKEALRRATQVDAARLPPYLVERRTHFLIDVARGHRQRADAAASVATLLQAEEVAPEEVRDNPAARNLIAELLRRERRAATPQLRELAARVGVPA